jgi:hypothetical protein
MAKKTLQDLYKEFMSNPHRTPMPGKTKHETALEEAYKQYRQSYNNDMALAMMPKDIEASYRSKKELTKEITEAINVSKLLKGITQKDIKTISSSIINSVNDIKKSMRKADAASARERGLVPQTGDWDAPGRWVNPDSDAEGSTSEEGEPDSDPEDSTSEGPSTEKPDMDALMEAWLKTPTPEKAEAIATLKRQKQVKIATSRRDLAQSSLNDATANFEEERNTLIGMAQKLQATEDSGEEPNSKDINLYNAQRANVQRLKNKERSFEIKVATEQEHIDKNTPVPASVGPIEEENKDDILSYNDDNDPDNLDEYGESTEDDWVGMDGEVKQWEFEAANKAEGFKAESSGWGGGQEHEEDDFNPETGELLVPGKNAEAVKQWAKRLGGEVGVPLVGGPTGSEPDDNIYQYHKFENGHMGGNPITPQHIADYVKFKTGKDISIPEQFRISSTDTESEVEIQSMQKNINSITKEHIQGIAQEIIKELIKSKESAKAKGLVPQSGDEDHPGRWVKPGNQSKKNKKKKPLKRKKHKGSTIKIQETNAPAKKGY